MFQVAWANDYNPTMAGVIWLMLQGSWGHRRSLFFDSPYGVAAYFIVTGLAFLLWITQKLRNWFGWRYTPHEKGPIRLGLTDPGISGPGTHARNRREKDAKTRRVRRLFPISNCRELTPQRRSREQQSIEFRTNKYYERDHVHPDQKCNCYP
jgi:hypothetical protein